MIRRPDSQELTRRFVVHPAGWAAVAALVVASVLAVGWGWQGAAAAAVITLVAMVVALVVVLRPVTFTVEVQTQQQRIVVGKVSVAELVVTAGKRGSSAAVVDVPVGDLRASFLVPRLAPGETWREPFLIPTEKRQVLALGPATASRTDAVGLISRDTVLSGRELIYVHPATLVPGYDATGLLRDIEGVQSETLSPSDVAFHALRDYQPGDDRRHVHWPTTAKHQRLVVRQFEETRRSEHVIIIDTRMASYPDPAKMSSPKPGERPQPASELALSIGASYGVEGIMLDREVAVWCGPEQLPMSTPTRFLDEVTAVECVTDPEAQVAEDRELDALVLAAVREAPQVSALTIVTGTEVADDAIVRALRAVPLSATGMCIRATTTGRVQRTQLDGAPMFTMSTLEQLRQVSAAVGA
ncbi:DUF58 domain-containing protein [Gulosibacter bifidus]|uniref:DUF58 domain-containing protein n=1 Tax=Gulosibacter bifidus TaxID=272239 RepID=A0ABW5RJW3_9MICO|nr:DUF58 domain-containing protein [Gulosibacter bifidus]